VKRLDQFNRVTFGNWETAGDDTQFRVEAEGNRAILLFQCSMSDTDWKYNFDFPPRLYKDSPNPWRILGGFKRVWRACQEKIMAKVRDADSLTTIGYSHGAVLAALALEDWDYSVKKNPAEAVVFGCPRFAFLPTREIQSRFSRLTRVEIRGDLVANLPPPLGFRHVGHVERYGPWLPIPLPSRHQPESYRKWLS